MASALALLESEIDATEDYLQVLSVLPLLVHEYKYCHMRTPPVQARHSVRQTYLTGCVSLLSLPALLVQQYKY
jgi:hypothetical protein